MGAQQSVETRRLSQDEEKADKTVQESEFTQTLALADGDGEHVEKNRCCETRATRTEEVTPCDREEPPPVVLAMIQ